MKVTITTAPFPLDQWDIPRACVVGEGESYETAARRLGTHTGVVRNMELTDSRIEVEAQAGDVVEYEHPHRKHPTTRTARIYAVVQPDGGLRKLPGGAGEAEQVWRSSHPRIVTPEGQVKVWEGVQECIGTLLGEAVACVTYLGVVRQVAEAGTIGTETLQRLREEMVTLETCVEILRECVEHALWDMDTDHVSELVTKLPEEGEE